jgi:quinolinate synthase
MKKITLEKVLNSLETLEPKIRLSEDIIKKAKKPLQKMMQIGRGD